MAFKVLLVVLAISMLLTSGTERSDEASPRGRPRLCLCSNRVLRLSSQDSEAPSSASCEEMCSLNSKAGVFSSLSRHHLRSRRDVLNGNEKCLFTRFRPDWKVKNITVAFHRSENISVWFAEVSWSPFNGSSHLWSGYYLVYFTGNRMRSPIYCPVIPKNQTSVNISSTEKVEMINLNISVIPKSLNSTIDLVTMDLDPHTSDNVNVHVTPPLYNVDPTEGTTPRPPPTFPPTSSDVPTKLIAAISGAASGFLLLVFAFLVYRKQIKLPWPFRSCFSASGHGPVELNPSSFNSHGAFIALPDIDPAVLPDPKKTSDLETYYAYYYPESPSYQLEVAKVVNYFRGNGYTVEMDVMNSNERLDLGPTRWAEQQIKKALNVLIFLSPGLLRLCGSDDDGVEFSHQESEHRWFELDLILREYTQTRSMRKMVCIILPNTGVHPRNLPPWAQITYKWPEDVQNIFKRLNGRPIIQPS